jgi:hypothetical protein
MSQVLIAQIKTASLKMVYMVQWLTHLNQHTAKPNITKIIWHKAIGDSNESFQRQS